MFLKNWGPRSKHTNSTMVHNTRISYVETTHLNE